MTWEKGTVFDLCDINPENVSRNYPHDFIKYFDITSVGSGIVCINDEISLRDAPSRAKRVVRNSDTIIATVRPGNKSFYYFKTAFENSVASTGFAVLRPKEKKTDPRFLYYLISEPRFTDYLVAYEQGANYPAVNPDIIGGKPILFPSLPTQRKIASILSAYDDLIENNLKRIKLLEEKANLHYAQYKPTEYFELQNKAEYLGRGVSPKYEEGSGFYAINQKANKGSMLDYNHFKSLDTKLEVPAEKFAKWGDLLINSLGEGTLGRVHFYTDKSDLYAVDQHMSIFRTSELHYTFYLYQFLSSDYGQGLIETLKKGGTNMTMLNISDLRELEVSFPKEKELKELWAIAEPMYKLKQTLTSENAKLREARDILLPRLMSGEIEV
jgi:type I restriction enzyme S subunit